MILLIFVLVLMLSVYPTGTVDFMTMVGLSNLLAVYFSIRLRTFSIAEQSKKFCFGS